MAVRSVAPSLTEVANIADLGNSSSIARCPFSAGSQAWRVAPYRVRDPQCAEGELRLKASPPRARLKSQRPMRKHAPAAPLTECALLCEPAPPLSDSTRIQSLDGVHKLVRALNIVSTCSGTDGAMSVNGLA